MEREESDRRANLEQILSTLPGEEEIEIPDDNIPP